MHAAAEYRVALRRFENVKLAITHDLKILLIKLFKARCKRTGRLGRIVPLIYGRTNNAMRDILTKQTYWGYTMVGKNNFKF